MRRVGQQLEPALGGLALQVLAGLACRASAPRALLEQPAQRLVQGVDVQDRRGVVVGGGPLDPVRSSSSRSNEYGTGVRAGATNALERALDTAIGDMPGRAARHFCVHEYA